MNQAPRLVRKVAKASGLVSDYRDLTVIIIPRATEINNNNNNNKK